MNCDCENKVKVEVFEVLLARMTIVIIVLAIVAMILAADCVITAIQWHKQVGEKVDSVVEQKMVTYCYSTIDQKIGDAIDDRLKYILENYDIEIVRQDGDGLNVYQNGDGSISVQK